MRSHTEYIVTKDEVHRFANDWLSWALKLEYKGTKCTVSTLIQVLLIAATRVASIFAVCRDLADAPCDQTIRDGLAASLPGIAELEIYRSSPKSGTTHFHAYATAAVVHKGHRYTLALTHVEYGEKMKPIVQRLLAIVRLRKVKVRFLLLDKGLHPRWRIVFEVEKPSTGFSSRAPCKGVRFQRVRFPSGNCRSSR